MAAITSEARIERFKTWLEAKAAPQRAAGLKPGSNLLLASALHGLARRGKGHSLTDLEQKAVKPFEAMTDSEEELLALGQICSQAKVAARSRSFAAFNAPSGIMNLSEDDPLTREQFDDQVRELGEETVLQPHIRAVAPDQVQSDGQAPQTEEFLAASSSLGRALTMYVGTESDDVDVDVASRVLLPVNLVPSIFKCYKRSKELGKDEVYFTWGWGSDSGYRVSHRTPEFGSVVQGTVRDFPPGPSLQQGNIAKAIAGTVICWEADHSDSAWYNKLIQAMNELSQLAGSLAHDVGNDGLNALIGLLPGFSEYADMVFWIENIAMVIGALLDWLRNKDDKVAEHNYGFSREFLRQYQRPDVYLDFSFNGGDGGNHSMFVRALVGPDYYPDK
jgi:hypothetical protein